MTTTNNFIAVGILFLISMQSMAQIPVLEWAGHMGGINAEEGKAIAVDTDGNVYTAGRFQGMADLDPGPEIVNLDAVGWWDIYIQKLDGDGNLLWVKQIGQSFDIKANSIAVDAAGDVFIAGSFQGTIDFDPGPENHSLTAPGEDGGYVLKLDPNGNFEWAIHTGGDAGAIASSLALDTLGNVYTIGSFLGTVDFDPGNDVYSLTSFGWWDIYVLKLDTDGNFIWAKQMGGTDIEFGTSIAVAASGHVYTTGYFTSIADFDPGSETFNLEAFGDYNDIFIQKLDADGDFIWAKQIGGNSYDRSKAIAVDSFENVYTTGWFEDTADFDPGSDTFSLTSIGGRDIFINKLDANGDFLWAKRMGSTYGDEGFAIAIDTAGGVYTTGYFQGTTDFDPGTNTMNLNSIGSFDAFIQKLDTDGNFVWALQYGSNSYDISNAIMVDASANVYTTGYFTYTVDFDPGVNTHSFTALGDNDIVVQKLSHCYATAIPIPYNVDLPPLNALCVLQAWDVTNPLAMGDCGQVITGYPDLNFPVSNQSITEILWTYEDGYGNVSTQTQPISWVDMDVTTSVNAITITANNANGTYQWLDCDNNDIPIIGATNQSFTASANGNYAVEITEGGCVGTSECVAIISVGLNEPDQINTLTVYPNPITEIVYIAFEKSITNATLSISDVNGKLIYTTKVHNTANASIDFKAAPGVYFLNIKSKDGQKTVQIVKE
ncbi:T9SS type A sorting domain-containing protein [Cryomorpha ignava]|uniref:T9SS type A sorting domain-containing protein n=1 Tax=Cryomorpha ignava TaxID=101383 RepID=A0A7K3WWB7_9FLAO|nr:SBBP repeat-containing protein [Cryomorpha ignava]NEN25222.1 T9SS type A sorting domain-containing protein [Cryomorpha ignava]